MQFVVGTRICQEDGACFWTGLELEPPNPEAFSDVSSTIWKRPESSAEGWTRPKSSPSVSDLNAEE